MLYNCCESVKPFNQWRNSNSPYVETVSLNEPPALRKLVMSQLSSYPDMAMVARTTTTKRDGSCLLRPLGGYQLESRLGFWEGGPYKCGCF